MEVRSDAMPPGALPPVDHFPRHRGGRPGCGPGRRQGLDAQAAWCAQVDQSCCFRQQVGLTGSVGSAFELGAAGATETSLWRAQAITAHCIPSREAQGTETLLLRAQRIAGSCRPTPGAPKPPGTTTASIAVEQWLLPLRFRAARADPVQVEGAFPIRRCRRDAGASTTEEVGVVELDVYLPTQPPPSRRGPLGCAGLCAP